MSSSDKYPRTFHFPWSPGGTSDDKRLPDISSLLNVPVVLTEKLDGSNLALTRTNVFARSHSGPPTHKSFHTAKATHAAMKYRIPSGLTLFCEYCYAVHSIVYDALPGYFFVFGVRDEDNHSWYSWDDVTAVAQDMGFLTVPILGRGTYTNEASIKSDITALAKQTSIFGGIREGVVGRLEREFDVDAFPTSVAKYVRADHVQTDEHWKNQPVRPQRLRQ